MSMILDILGWNPLPTATRAVLSRASGALPTKAHRNHAWHFCTIRRVRGVRLCAERLRDELQAVVPPEHLIADEERGGTEDPARDRVVGIRLERGFYGLRLAAGDQRRAVEAGRGGDGGQHLGVAD